MITQERSSDESAQRSLELVVQNGDRGPKCEGQRARDVLELESDHEASAADFLDDRRVLLAKGFEPVDEVGARHPRIVHEALVVEDVEAFDRGDRRFAHSAERRRAMDHGGSRLAVGLHVDVATRDHRGHRALATSKRFRECGDVRHDAVLLEREERAGAAHPALNLVRNPENAKPIASGPHALPVRSRGLDDAAAALDRLEAHDTDLTVGLQRANERVEVTERNLTDLSNEIELSLVKC